MLKGQPLKILMVLMILVFSVLIWTQRSGVEGEVKDSIFGDGKAPGVFSALPFNLSGISRDVGLSEKGFCPFINPYMSQLFSSGSIVVQNNPNNPLFHALQFTLNQHPYEVCESKCNTGQVEACSDTSVCEDSSLGDYNSCTASCSSDTSVCQSSCDSEFKGDVSLIDTENEECKLNQLSEYSTCIDSCGAAYGTCTSSCDDLSVSDCADKEGAQKLRCQQNNIESRKNCLDSCYSDFSSCNTGCDNSLKNTIDSCVVSNSESYNVMDAHIACTELCGDDSQTCLNDCDVYATDIETCLDVGACEKIAKAEISTCYSECTSDEVECQDEVSAVYNYDTKKYVVSCQDKEVSLTANELARSLNSSVSYLKYLGLSDFGLTLKDEIPGWQCFLFFGVLPFAAMYFFIIDIMGFTMFSRKVKVLITVLSSLIAVMTGLFAKFIWQLSYIAAMSVEGTFLMFMVLLSFISIIMNWMGTIMSSTGDMYTRSAEMAEGMAEKYTFQALAKAVQRDKKK